MICPHCLKTIEDGASFCPYCNAYVGPGDGPEHTEFVFCEGCGARLSPHDRTCPKCGRPAPGILSEDAAASDLAAGRTAGFPRLTQEQIDTEVPHAPASAAAVLSDAADFNPVRAGRNGFLQCLRRIKLAAQLIEIGNLQIRPQFHGTGVRLHLPQNSPACHRASREALNL